jgi:7,8-dihydropterin-6-yl-methyl-4-(beta-D-ribofuranosyl)aminobenzene 5'-phosphate synthase
VLCETPTVIAGHAFTTGKITRRSGERILPQTWVEFGIKDGLGCNAGHYLPAEMDGKIVADDISTNTRPASMSRIWSRGDQFLRPCRHRQFGEAGAGVSGIQKVHAIVGGFHLGPAPTGLPQAGRRRDQGARPDVLIPDALQRA